MIRAALFALTLAGCNTLAPILAAAHLPANGSCAAYGLTVTRSLPSGRMGGGVGCVEQRPAPGMARPGRAS